MPKNSCPTCKLVKDIRAFQCSACRFKYNHPRETQKWAVNRVGYREKRIDGKLWLEHRHVMTLSMGRELRQKEHVHHIDGNKLNNNIDNLKLMITNDHHRHHMTSLRAKRLSRLGHEARWGVQNSYL